MMMFLNKQATMICIDNSEWMRNGDYIPSRFQAQSDAVNLICGAKTQVTCLCIIMLEIFFLMILFDFFFYLIKKWGFDWIYRLIQRTLWGFWQWREKGFVYWPLPPLILARFWLVCMVWSFFFFFFNSFTCLCHWFNFSIGLLEILYFDI